MRVVTEKSNSTAAEEVTTQSSADWTSPHKRYYSVTNIQNSSCNSSEVELQNKLQYELQNESRKRVRISHRTSSRSKTSHNFTQDKSQVE